MKTDLLQNYVLIFFSLKDSETPEFHCHYMVSFHNKPSNERIEEYKQKVGNNKKVRNIKEKVYTYLWEITNPVLLSEFDFNEVADEFIEWCYYEATK